MAQWDYSEAGWEYIAYEGELVHAPTGTLCRARLQIMLVMLEGTEVITPTSFEISLWELPQEKDLGSWQLDAVGGKEADKELIKELRKELRGAGRITYAPRKGVIPRLPEEAKGDFLFFDYVRDMAKYEALSGKDVQRMWEGWKRQQGK